LSQAKGSLKAKAAAAQEKPPTRTVRVEVIKEDPPPSRTVVAASVFMYPPPPPERIGWFPDDAKASIQKIIDAIVAVNCPACLSGLVLIVAKTELKKWEDSCWG